MLEINVATQESYDEIEAKFGVIDSVKVRLEHSLVSVSKWESLWKKAFLGSKDKTAEEVISYIQLMVLNDELSPEVFQNLVHKHQKEIQAYIEDEMTATKLYNDPNAPTSRETITSELIYYWMISMQIPVEFQHWHINRLITLIRVINVKNSPKKKMSMNERRALNRSRLSKHKTRG